MGFPHGIIPLLEWSRTIGREKYARQSPWSIATMQTRRHVRSLFITTAHEALDQAYHFVF
jgi:hypothetical protein